MFTAAVGDCLRPNVWRTRFATHKPVRRCHAGLVEPSPATCWPAGGPDGAHERAICARGDSFTLPVTEACGRPAAQNCIGCCRERGLASAPLEALTRSWHCDWHTCGTVEAVDLRKSRVLPVKQNGPRRPVFPTVLWGRGDRKQSARGAWPHSFEFFPMEFLQKFLQSDRCVHWSVVRLSAAATGISWPSPRGDCRRWSIGRGRLRARPQDPVSATSGLQQLAAFEQVAGGFSLNKSIIARKLRHEQATSAPCQPTHSGNGCWVRFSVPPHRVVCHA